MNAIALEQTASYLTRHVRRWDRRMRLLASIVWGPRALIAGLLFGVAIAIVARMRPWLLPDQILFYTALVMATSSVTVLAFIWLWPRSVPQSARQFDVRFGLKERVSTALELAGGLLVAPVEIGDRQLKDAVNAAGRVNVRVYLPLRVRWLELALLVLLVVLFAYLLLTPNPKTDELLAERELQDAIDAQAEELAAAIEEIENNPALTPLEQQALTEPLQEALDILQQESVSQEEAVAALAEAQQSLQELSDGLPPDQEGAYKEAASALAGSEMTSDLAEAMDKPDLRQSARELEELAEELGEREMSQEERDTLADQLESAADALQESNPAVAEKLREAAEALREGDTQAAQEALREAAELLEQQQEQLENSEMAESAREAGEQVQQSQRELARAGLDESGEAPADMPPTGQQQSGEMPEQAPEGSQPQAGQQPGEQQSEGESQGAGQGEQQGEQPGEGAPQSGQQAGDGSEPGDAPGAGGEQAQAQESEGEQQGGEAESGSNSPSAGQGEGGEGSDTVTGDQAGAPDEGSVNQNSSADGDFEGYTPENDPSAIGGESDDVVDVGGEGETPGEGPVQEGEFGPNPEGEATLDYSGVYSDYQDVVSDALESGRIPLDQRDVIHDYFASLEQ